MDKSEPATRPQLLLPALGAWVVVLSVAGGTNLALSGVLKSQAAAPYWLWLSETGGPWGMILMLAIATGLAASMRKELSGQGGTAMRWLLMLLVVLLPVAWLNEAVIKPQLGLPRPYTLHLEKEGVIDPKALYALPSKAQRTAKLEAALVANAHLPAIKNLHPRVRQHWLSHTGFSFPSGHSLNAFLFAVLLASLLAHHPRLSQGWIYVPFMWAAGVCLSRVALGAHTLLDVAVGALAGGAIGLGLMSLGFLRRWLLLEDSPIALREWVGDSKVRG